MCLSSCALDRFPFTNDIKAVDLLMSTDEKLPPNFSKLDIALRSIGYSLEVAVADIIDNAIDAQAQHVLVRFVLKPNAPLDVVIYDDGHGMNDSTLREAMRFGSDVSEHL